MFALSKRRKRIIGSVLMIVGSIYPLLLIVSAYDHWIEGTLRSMTFNASILAVALSISVLGVYCRVRGEVRKEKGEN